MARGEVRHHGRGTTGFHIQPMGADGIAKSLWGDQRVEVPDCVPQGTHRPKQPQPKPAGSYLARYVLGSQRMVRELAKEFPTLPVISSNDRLIVPLITQPPGNFMGRNKTKERVATPLGNRLPLVRMELVVPTDDQATYRHTDNGAQIQLAFEVSESAPWLEQLKEESREGTKLRQLKRSHVPAFDELVIAVTPDVNLANEAANFMIDQGYFNEGQITLSGIQICSTPFPTATK